MDRVINPKTGNFVKINSRIGKEIIKATDRCLAYPPKKKAFKPTPYQRNVEEYVENILYPYSDVRGLLLYWGLGSGKSCGAITAINKYHHMYPERKVYVWTMGSLRSNFIEQYCQVCGDDKLSTWFVTATMNQANVKGVLDQIDMNNSLIIVDEAHHLWHGRVNESEQYTLLYDALLNSVNSRFIFLTGTPLLSDVKELYYLFLLVYPQCNWDYKDFKDRFFKLNQKEMLEWFTLFVFPYFPTLKGEYPESTEEFVDVPFSTTEHESQYMEARRKEAYKAMQYPDDNLKKRNYKKYKDDMVKWYLAYSMIVSRQLSNVNYPNNVQVLKLEGQNINDMIYNPIKNREGWIYPETKDDLHELSEKLTMIMNRVKSSPGKHVIYSYFVTNSGINFISSMLTLNQINHLTFDGSLDDTQRETRLREFNDDINAHGEKYKVLLITNAAAEGITLLSVRALHIMEQSIQEWQIDQIKGRVVRLNSHLQLPPDERNVIIYRYMITPKQKTIDVYNSSVPSSSDVASYQIGLENKKSIAPFVDLMKQSQFVQFYAL